MHRLLDGSLQPPVACALAGGYESRCRREGSKGNSRLLQELLLRQQQQHQRCWGRQEDMDRELFAVAHTIEAAAAATAAAAAAAAATARFCGDLIL
ncbi:hypothetical protein Emag_006517 [Eimeria magna]